MASNDANPLFTLPTEVIDIVLTEAVALDARILLNLRLVSKAMNSFAEPKAFYSTTIRFSNENLHSIGQYLNAIQSPMSLYSRWTRRLRVDFAVNLSSGVSRARMNERELQGHRLEVGEVTLAMIRYKSLLLSAIHSLQNVSLVDYTIDDRGLYEDVLKELARLPKLHSLCLRFPPRWSKPLPMDGFSDLRQLEVHVTNPSTAIVEGIARVVSKSPSLQTLLLLSAESPISALGFGLAGATSNTLGVPVEDLFNSLAQPHPLKKLVLSGNGFEFSPSTPHVFRSLVHLDFKDPIIDRDDSFWLALSRAGIHLRHLAVYPITPALSRYLLSFKGLRNLCIKQARLPTSRPQTVDSPYHLFYQILPHHQSTLEFLSFDGSLELDTWGITEPYLNSIIQCQRLRGLDLIYSHPDRRRDVSFPMNPSIDLRLLLLQVTQRLQILETLVIRPQPCFNDFGSLFRLELAICAVRIAAIPTSISNPSRACSSVRYPSFSIHVVSPRASVDVDQSSRGLRFNERFGCFDFPKTMIISQF